MRKKPLLWLAFISAIPVFAMAAWLGWHQHGQISKQLHRICLSGANKVVLADITPFEWDQVVILTPYAGQSIADKAIRFSWKDYDRYRDALDSEGKDVLIFLNKRQIVRTIEHLRIDGDFSDRLAGERLTRREAVFAFRRIDESCNFVALELSKK